MGKGSGDNSRPSLLNDGGDSKLTRDTPVAVSANYGHAYQLVGGITIQQQEELLMQARASRINILKFIRDRYDIGSLQYVPTTKLPAIIKSLENQVAEDAPKWQHAQQLATDVRWGYNLDHQHETHRQRAQWLVEELAARLGAFGKVPVGKNNSSWDRIGSGMLATVADEMMAIDAGHPIRYTARTVFNHERQTVTTIDVDEVRSVLTQLSDHVEAYFRAHEDDDWFEDDTPADWREACEALKTVELVDIALPVETTYYFDDEHEGSVGSVTWSATAVPAT